MFRGRIEEEDDRVSGQVVGLGRNRKGDGAPYLASTIFM